VSIESSQNLMSLIINIINSVAIDFAVRFYNSRDLFPAFFILDVECFVLWDVENRHFVGVFLVYLVLQYHFVYFFNILFILYVLFVDLFTELVDIDVIFTLFVHFLLLLLDRRLEDIDFLFDLHLPLALEIVDILFLLLVLLMIH